MLKAFTRAAVITALLLPSLSLAEDHVRSARIVTSSDALQIDKSDHSIGLKRTTNPHPTVAKLPPDAEPNQVFVVDDLADNFSEYPVTVVAPPGHVLSGDRHKFVLNRDSGRTGFRYFGDHNWGVEQ
jgi:hypothetical protein